MKIFNKYILTGLVVLIGFSSCDKDFLQRTPLDQGSVEGFFETQEDVIRAINGIYDVFQGSIWGGSFYWMHQNFDILTDNGVGCCPWEAQYTTIAEGQHNPGTGGIINFKWDFGYEGIFRANSVLENMGNVGLDQGTLTQYEAEVRFLRGLIYQEMTTLFGDLPLITTVLTRDEGLEATRAPKAQVLAQIYEDLDFAEANLDLTPNNGDIGRPTKQSAIAVKARLKMYNGDWAGAAAEAKKIMDLSAANPNLIGLVDNYIDVFSPTNENNKEVLFDIQYTGGTQGEGNFMQVALAPGPEGTPGNGWGSITPTDQLANAFYMRDGLPADESPLFDADNPYMNRDPRLYDNLFVPGISTWRGETFDASLAGFSPYFAIRKWVDPEATIGENGCSCNETNVILYRYADILMIYAESMNELNGPTDEVYEALNAVVTRAGMPAYEPGHSQDEMREVIHHERHVEFPWEGTRYHDLIRWRKAAETIPTVTLFGESLDDRQFITPKHYLWPVPQKEIDLNPNLSQNPGY
ncbi:RagB/SusD family nutrient uptake outer membrane protein [Portibacter marinus]|uniref:RagB/SusD family nutrient uptake outer membrane protein n=1 Tax=Portibacter marinus TaxID=2898660 RepID=UPI001F3C564D|nr:RagB/SusD family nutrient uptake outer membrane protein [Portibacter marinus]